MQWADQDTKVLAFTRIEEYKHNFLQHRYLKEDGMPGMYSPDFLLRTEDRIYVIETKAQNQVSAVNVQRKKRAAKAWCDRINELGDTYTRGKSWYYVILGESPVKQFHAANARVSELLEYARLTDVPKETERQERLV